MRFIDPLLIRLIYLLEDGKSNSLTIGRSHFGSEEDWRIFANLINNNAGKDSEIFLIDFSPFIDEGLVDLENKIAHIFSEYKNISPLILTYSKELSKKITYLDRGFNIPIAVLDENGNFESGNFFNHKDDEIYRSFSSNFIDTKVNILELRNEFSNENLYKLLNKNPNAVIDKDNNVYFEIITHASRKLLKMNNNMAVSKYVCPKELGIDNENLIYIAYEIILRIKKFFSPAQIRNTENPKLLVVNNTSLYFAATVQSILKTNLFIVDRLGPIPFLSPPFDKLRENIYGSEVVLIQDIRTTGSETDRAKIFLDQLLVTIKEAIVIYNLEAGISKLVPDHKTISLCCPKEKLDYVYTSYFKSQQK